MNQKERRILLAADRLFARFGHKKTSMDEIAQMAGIGKGTVYLYFKSKEDLYAAVVRNFGTSMLDAMSQAALSSSSPSVQLRQLIWARLHFVQNHLNEQGATPEAIREFAEIEHGPLIGPIIREFSEIQIKMIYDLILAGMKCGEFEASNPEVTAVAMFSAMHTCGRPWICHGTAIHLDDQVKTFVNLFLNGLLKRSSNASEELHEKS